MKILLFLIAVFVLLWLLKGTVGRRRGGTDAKTRPPPANPTQTIVACAQCGVHLPQGEALPGKGGVFCGDAHRAAYEKERARP